MSQERLSSRCVFLLTCLCLFTLLLLTPASAAASAISGVVRTHAGVAASGVSVGLYQGDVLKQSTTTNAEGRYYFTELAEGTWAVLPSQTGKIFDPRYRMVTLPPHCDRCQLHHQ